MGANPSKDQKSTCSDLGLDLGLCTETEDTSSYILTRTSDECREMGGDYIPNELANFDSATLRKGWCAGKGYFYGMVDTEENCGTNNWVVHENMGTCNGEWFPLINKEDKCIGAWEPWTDPGVVCIFMNNKEVHTIESKDKCAGSWKPIKICGNSA